MKKWIFLATVPLVFLGCQKADLSSDKGQYSYAVGHQIGKNIKSQNIDIDHKAFAQAVQDVLSGKKSQMEEEQMREALKKMADVRKQNRQKAAEENLKKGQAFLEGNKSADGVKVTDSGLQYKVVKEGSGASPKADDVVQVHYRGKLIDGTEFDSSYKRNRPAEFPVKAVIPGWTEALQLMKKGAVYQLFIPPALAYGERGNPTIPGNSVLIFDVELLDIKAGKK